jgi:hypothetical protein
MKNKIPFLITILSLIGGVLIAIGFGANEDYFKAKIQKGLATNPKIQSIQDPMERADKIKTEADKNWRYYLRYHFHANGIAGVTLALLIFLAFIETTQRQMMIASYSLSIGGFLYPFVWLFAGIYGPEMGRDEAKEAFRFFGYSGGLYLIGLVYSFYLAIAKQWRSPMMKSP